MLRRRLRPQKQFGKIVVDACHAEVRFALEGLPDIVDAVCVALEEFHYGKNEIIGLVERVEDFIAGYRDCRRAGYATLYLDEAQLPGTRHTALDIIAKFLKPFFIKNRNIKRNP